MQVYAPQQTRAEEGKSSSPAVGEHSAPGAAVSGLAWDFVRSSVLPRRAEGMQAKLAINEPGDEYEREADDVADQIMRMPAGASAEPDHPGDGHGGRRCSCGGTCSRCGEEKAMRAGPQIQREPVVNVSLGSGIAPPAVERVLRSPGEMLDFSTRAFMEPRFGRDFSQVRIHSDPQAAQSAESIGARAYAAGSHIAFGPDEYAPNTEAGRSLLAHELTHVVQQSGLPPMLSRKPKGMGAADQSVPRDVSRQLGQPLTENDMLQMIIKARAEPLGESISIIGDDHAYSLELGKRESTLSQLRKAKSAADWNEHVASQHMKGPRDREYTRAVREANEANVAVNEAAKAVLRLEKARAIGTLKGGGAPAGTGQITYAVIQVTDAKGKRIALRLDTTGADGHAEERILRWLEKTFEGRLEQLEGGHIQVVGDQIVCEKICAPALIEFATRMKMHDVIATVFPGLQPGGEVIAPRGYVRGATEPTGAGTTTVRETKVVYQSPEAVVAAGNAATAAATAKPAVVDSAPAAKSIADPLPSGRTTVEHATFGEPTTLPTTCVAPGEAMRGDAEGFGSMLLSKQFSNMQQDELDKITDWKRHNSWKFGPYWAQGLDPVVTIIFQVPNTIEVLDLAFGTANQMQLLRFKDMRITGEQLSRREGQIPYRAPSKSAGNRSDEHATMRASQNPYTGLAERAELHMNLDQDLRYEMGDKYAMYGKPDPGYHFDETTEIEYSPAPYHEPTPESDLPDFPGALKSACAVHGYPDPKMDWSKPLIRIPQPD